MKLSSGLRSISITYGRDITACYSYGRFEKCLYQKSPKERDRLNVPFTLPSFTYPPAFSILFFYVGTSGLWSYDRGMAVSLRDRTALESPILATQYLSFVTSNTTAVVPALQLIFYTFDEVTPNLLLITYRSSYPRALSNKVSIRLNTFVSAFGQFFNLKQGQFRIYLGSTWDTQWATYGPPCPSKTANIQTLSESYWQMIASYMVLRQPEQGRQYPASMRRCMLVLSSIDILSFWQGLAS